MFGGHTTPQITAFWSG